MAYSEVATHIQNPGRKRKARKRRKLSAAQIRAGFGGKRRKNSARHRRRTKPNPSKHRKRATARRHSPRRRVVHRTKKRATARRHNPTRRRKTSHRRRAVRHNPELVSFLLGNPAQKRRKKGMARRHKKRAVARRHNAGTRRRRVVRHRRHHRNPAGIGSPKQWLFGGAGALAGFVGSAAIPQMVLGASNTGVTGYVGTAAATIGLALLSAFLLPRQQAVTFGVAAGGFANLLRRIITDQTPFGSYVSGTGMGDYMVSNWGPPLMSNGLQSAMAAPYGTAVAASSGVSMADMGDITGGYHRPC